MAKRNIGKEVEEGLQHAIDYMHGKKSNAVTHKVIVPQKINVKAIREKLHLTREEFANRYGFSARTLQHWEQGDRNPHGPAKVLLLLLQREPTVIEKILKRPR